MSLRSFIFLPLIAATFIALPPGGPTARAQTPMGAPPSRPVGAAVPTAPSVPQPAPSMPPQVQSTQIAVPMATSQGVSQGTKIPVPDTVLKQAELQAEGVFPKMRRSLVGGQVQDAWDDSKPEEGVVEFNHCPKCTYKVRLREYMVTVIEFPEGETIERADTGDVNEFAIKQRGARRLSIQPAGYGVDSNLVVYGKSGAVYPIYLRAERFNSTNVPDLLVRISGRVRVAAAPSGASATSKEPPAIAVAGIGEVERADLPPLAPPDKKASAKAGAVAGLKPDPKPQSNDFVQDAPFDPNKLRGWGDYEVWAGGTAGETLKPATVFRDDYFTYIRFDATWNDTEYPTAYVVVDGIDELVNTRRQGQTLIVESTNRLITLKSGKSFLCIKYKGAS